MDSHHTLVDANIDEFSGRLQLSFVTEDGAAEYVWRFDQINHQAADLDVAISDPTTEAPAGARVTFTGFGTMPEVVIGFFADEY